MALSALPKPMGAMTALYERVSWVLKQTRDPADGATEFVERAAASIRRLTHNFDAMEHEMRVFSLEETLSHMHSAIDKLRPLGI